MTDPYAGLSFLHVEDDMTDGAEKAAKAYIKQAFPTADRWMIKSLLLVFKSGAGWQAKQDASTIADLRASLDNVVKVTFADKPDDLGRTVLPCGHLQSASRKGLPCEACAQIVRSTMDSVLLMECTCPPTTPENAYYPFCPRHVEAARRLQHAFEYEQAVPRPGERPVLGQYSRAAYAWWDDTNFPPDMTVKEMLLMAYDAGQGHFAEVLANPPKAFLEATGQYTDDDEDD